MTIIRRYNTLLPDYLERFFGKDYQELNHYHQPKPRVNVVENNDDFVLEMAAPGYNKKDFEINVENELLTISVKNEVKNDQNYVLREFNANSFERVFTLPESVISDNIKATYQDGILYVTIPKKEEAKPKPPRLIEIK